MASLCPRQTCARILGSVQQRRTLCGNVPLQRFAPHLREVPLDTHSTDGRTNSSSFALKLGIGGLAASVVALSASSIPTMCQEQHSPGTAAPSKQNSTLINEPAPRLIPKDLEQLLQPTPDNPIPVMVPPPMPGLHQHQWARHRHVAPIFGLPMRGKVHLANTLKRYIEFYHGARAHVFDLHDYLGPGGDDRLYSDLIEFFEANAADDHVEDPDKDIKGQYFGGFAIICASDTVESCSSVWSAHSKYNRRWMAKVLLHQLHVDLCFIQISVDENDPDALDYMKRLGESRGKTLTEVKSMIEEYSDHYVPIQMDGTERKVPFIQLVNYNQTMIVNHMMQSFVGSRVCQFLSNTHPYQHTIYLSRHGESEYNVLKRLGGDSSLSPRGREYSRRVGEFSKYVIAGKATNLVCVTLSQQELQSLSERVTMTFDDQFRGLCASGDWSGYGDTSGGVISKGMRLVRLQPGFGTEFIDAPATLSGVMEAVGDGRATLVFVEGTLAGAGEVHARLWTSSLKRTQETAEFIPHPILPGTGKKQWHQMARRTHRSLDEVYAGEYDGLTEAEIAKRFPQVIKDRKKDKLGFRYPRGESYLDIIARLDDVMTNLERVREPILIISHQAVLRMILGWLKEVPREESLKLTFPQHGIVKISFDGLSRRYSEFPLGPEKLGDDGQGNL